MSDIKQEIQNEITSLRKEIGIARENVDDFSKRYFNGVRENTLVYCLKRATDIAEGCVIVAEAGLPASLHTLTRSLFESLVWTCWIAISDENAQEFTEAAVNELKRIARKNLRVGLATIKEKATGEDRTQDFLESWKSIPKRRRIEDLAKDSGLGKVYTMIYGFMSMHAHSNIFGISSDANVDEEILTPVAGANSLMECINLVVKEWIVNRKETTISEIHSILNIQ